MELVKLVLSQPAGTWLAVGGFILLAGIASLAYQALRKVLKIDGELINTLYVSAISIGAPVVQNLLNGNTSDFTTVAGRAGLFFAAMNIMYRVVTKPINAKLSAYSISIKKEAQAYNAPDQPEAVTEFTA